MVFLRRWATSIQIKEKEHFSLFYDKGKITYNIVSSSFFIWWFLGQMSVRIFVILAHAHDWPQPRRSRDIPFSWKKYQTNFLKLNLQIRIKKSFEFDSLVVSMIELNFNFLTNFSYFEISSKYGLAYTKTNCHLDEK